MARAQPQEPVVMKMTDGSTFLIDDQNYDHIKMFPWCDDGNGCPMLTIRPHMRITMILKGKPPEGSVWDHADGNPRNNTLANIRPATLSQNRQNSAKVRTKTTSKYKGVTWYPYNRRKKKLWWARIKLPDGPRLDLGHFETEEEAARAYDDAARKHFGEYARTNF